MPAVSVTITHAHETLAVEAEALQALARRVIAGETDADADLTIVLADHATVLALNRAYLAHDYLTDVLAFDLSETDDVLEGEVYVDLDTAAERHGEFGTTFEQEVRRYAVHGLLHLLGYEDATPEAKAAMHAREDQYLSPAP